MKFSGPPFTSPPKGSAGFVATCSKAQVPTSPGGPSRPVENQLQTAATRVAENEAEATQLSSVGEHEHVQVEGREEAAMWRGASKRTPRACGRRESKKSVAAQNSVCTASVQMPVSCLSLVQLNRM